MRRCVCVCACSCMCMFNCTHGCVSDIGATMLFAFMGSLRGYTFVCVCVCVSVCVCVCMCHCALCNCTHVSFSDVANFICFGKKTVSSYSQNKKHNYFD